PRAADRHADMDALLAALGEALRPRARTGTWIAAAAIAALGIGGVAARDDDHGCSDAPPLQGAASRETVAASILGDAPRDDAELARLWQRLDGFVEPWMAARAAVCELGPDHGVAFDRPLACLEQQRRDAEAAWAVLAGQPGLGTTRALAVLERLPDPSVCSDTASLAAAAISPPPPAQAEAVAALRDRLAEVFALDGAGEHEQALARAQALLPEVEALGYAPLLAEALLHLGAVQTAAGDYALAVATLERGHAEAVASRHDRMAGRIASELVFVEGERRGRLPEALAWAQHAAAAIDRAGTDDPSRLPSVLSGAYVGAGRLLQARQSAQQALAALLPARRADPARHGMLLNNLGDIERQLGELPAAREHLDQALRLWEQAYGPDHPFMAMVLNNLGALDLVTGDTVAAEAKLRRVVEIRERALGPAHPMLATSLANLAVCQRRNRDLVAARASFVRARDILRERGMGDDPKAVAMIAGIATVDAQAGELAAALRGFDEVVVAYEASQGELYPDLARVLVNRADARIRTGAIEAGLADAARSDAIAAEVWGAGHAKLAQNRLLVVHALDEVGEHERAQALVERALAELDDTADPMVAKLEAELRPLPAQVWP
ncbi:MAG: tetratricopeptide repeat protein, partial [Nannocystaceae bacterium]|nr:tetratricopeptide repeat protein [Nannocystaceae bacterium]